MEQTPTATAAVNGGRRLLQLALRLSAGWLLLSVCGCLVPQPRGHGRLERVVEPASQRPYYLYLPKDYIALDEAGRAARRWPLVVTFHGLKPFDTALYQSEEWQQEADRYGYIVVAPVLMAFDTVTGEFPLRTLNRTFKSDELAILAILDHVFETTRADPNNVLSTSWSSGGYMAHYMLNRHPERFTCLAVRQSDFTANVLDSTWTSQSLYHPVLILTAQNDFPVCQEESREAIRWYESHGYKNFAWVYLSRLGHERTPDMAADFFARVAGVAPNRPPEVLTRRQAIDGNPAGLALLSGKLGQLEKPPSVAMREEPHPALPRSRTQRRPVMMAVTVPPEPPPAPARAPDLVVEEPPPTLAQVEPTPSRGSQAGRGQRPASPVGIRVSASVGFEPLLLVYSADCPVDWQRRAAFHWTLDGKDVGQGLNGQRVIAEPGDYMLELRVATRDGAEHRAARRIRVLKSPEAAAVNATP
jgi:predicted esterase